MKSASVATRALDGGHVLRLGDDTDQPGVPARVPADGAGIALGQVTADAAKADLLLDVDDGGRQRRRILGRRAQDVKRQPGSGLFPDAGQLAQLLDQARDRRGKQAGQPPNMPGGSGNPPVALASSPCASSRARSSATLTAPTTRSSIILRLAGSPPPPASAGSTVMETISPLPLAMQRTNPPPVSPSTVLPARSSRTRATSAWIRCAVSMRPFKSGSDIRS